MSKKGKGFGQSQTPTRGAKEFILAFQDFYRKNKRDKTKIRQFFLANLKKLDSSLLEALPLVFTSLTADRSPDEREAIASLFGFFGNAIQEFALGDRSLNLELSIAAYSLILKIFTSEDFPEKWAMTKNTLATAYSERIRGDRAENLERAIELYEQALQVRTREAFPEDWAMTKNNLAAAYSERIRGDRAENLERAIELHEQALQVRTRKDFPVDWAGTTNNLANAYGDRIRGDRAENLERAIELYQQALQIYTREDFPVDWAMTKNNLAAAYSERIRGDRAENLERAIELHEQALQIYAREDFPEKWAMTKNNLALAYSVRIRGDRAENLERAIELYQQALQIYTREDFPEDWARTTNNLAIPYSDRIRGDRAENLERAIELYEQALQVRTREDFPEKWAATKNNLANAYRERIRGDRAENLERAIELYQQALQIYTREDFPEDWTGTTNNLATAYSDRIRGGSEALAKSDRAENLERAIDLHKQALQIHTREAFPEKWAENQGNLAEVLIQRADLTDNPADLDTAITLLQEALEVAVSGSPHYIDSHYRLGTALSRRYHHSKNPEDLQRALEDYKIALDAISPEHYDWKKIWQALPTTQTILGSRLVRDGQWQEGLQLLLNSVNQLSTSDDRLAHANALYHTGRAYEVLSDREKARLYYRDALRLYEHLQDLPGIAKSRTGLGNVFISLGHLEKGMEELDRAKETYQQLQESDKVKEVENLYQVAQRVKEQQTNEVYI